MAAAATPAAPSPWILGAWRDLVLFIGTPLLIFPLFAVAQLRWSAQDIYLFVGAFGAMGHHLPGMMRAYGDRGLFERFKARFIFAPIALVAVCVACTVWDLKGIEIIVFLWGVWHGMMQTYGFCRIYDAKAGGIAKLNARLDFAVCLSWFGAAVLLSPRRSRSLLDLYYSGGGPVISAAAVDVARTLAIWITAGITILFVLHLAWSWAQGRRPSLRKVVLLVTSIGFWWYCNLGVREILVGIALFEVFHDVQYLSIVWIYNRSRVEKDNTARGFLRFLFRRGGSFMGLYVGLVLAYGAVGLMTAGVQLDGVKRVLMGIVTASALLHFYYDGFIWKVRDRSNRQHLGLAEAGAADAAARRFVFAPWCWHGLKWTAFAAPIFFLGWIQLHGTKMPELERTQAVATAVPSDATARKNLGTAALREGRFDQAESEYAEAARLRPDDPEVHYFWGIARSDQGDWDGAIAHYRDALRLKADFPQAECNFANALFRLSRFEEAKIHYQRSLDQMKNQPLVHKNLGDLLWNQGDLDAAIDRYIEALRLAPDFSDARTNLRLAREARGLPPESTELDR